MAGVDVVAAVDIDPHALATHEANHGATRHYRRSVTDPDLPAELLRDVGPVDVVLASPPCTGHANARGKDRPEHAAARAAAWGVVDVVRALRPSRVCVENVPEFARWAEFPAWCDALRALGFTLFSREIDAALLGVAQHRVRLVIVGARGEEPVLHQPRVPRRLTPASSIVRWDSAPWSPVARPGRAPATLARIARGRAEQGDTFVAPYYGSGSGETGRSLARPLGTVTCLDRWALVRGDEMRMLTPAECARAQGFPESYRWHGTRRQRIMRAGNAIPPPLAAYVLGQCLPAAGSGS